MIRKPNIHGGGAKTNLVGLQFERDTNFITAIKKIEGIKTEEVEKQVYTIYHNNKEIGLYCEQYKFYNYFLKVEKINYKEILKGKKYKPEGIFFNYENNIAYVLEAKFQSGPGSVEEKLETCDFKKKMYSKLLKKTKYKVVLFYILSEYFNDKRNTERFQYILDSGCKYFFKTIGLNEFGIKI